MIYQLTRAIITTALKQFFRTIEIVGAPLESHPLIIVGNHQNFALDSLLITSGYKRELWYLGKATLFNNVILGMFLRAVHVSPLYRKQDDPTQLSKNDATFDAVVRHLRQVRAVLLFPEGISVGERMLAPIKTGAARMALRAIQQDIPVKLQAAGLTYSDLKSFKSTVTLTFGDPIDVEGFMHEAKIIGIEDEKELVRRLTTKIEEELRRVTVEIRTKEHEALIEKIAKIYSSSGSILNNRERFAEVAKNVDELAPKLPERRVSIERKMERYFNLAKVVGFNGDEQLIPTVTFLNTLPKFMIALIGTIVCYVPYQAVALISAKISSHPVYVQSSKFFLGLVLFPVWLATLVVYYYYLTLNISQAGLFFLLLLMTAVFANKYFTLVRTLLSYDLLGWRGNLIGRLLQMRTELIEELESLRLK